MRYFRVRQDKLPKCLINEINPSKVADIPELESMCQEITKEEVSYTPWGSGNIEVSYDGKMRWMTWNFDSSG